MKVCLDLTANETIDRHGGIGRYALRLLESLVEVKKRQAPEIELFAWLYSNEAALPAEQALDRSSKLHAEIPLSQHRMQRRLQGRRSLHAVGTELFHATQSVKMPWFPGCATVATVHDLVHVVHSENQLDLLGRVKQAGHWLSAWNNYVRPDHLIAISQQTKSDLRRALGVKRERITVVHHGVDSKVFNQKRDLSVTRKLPERFIVSVGSDHSRKNQFRLVEAWSSIADKVAEDLVLVGKGLYGETFRKISDLAEKRGLRDRLFWWDDVGDEELAEIYRSARVAVAPSLYEGFGMTLLEAMACGTPVVASRNGAYEEVAEDAAKYFDGRSVEDMAQVLQSLLADEGERKSLMAKGVLRAHRTTWQKTARETLEVYRKMLRG